MIKISIVEDIPEIREGLSEYIEQVEDMVLLDLFDTAEIALIGIPENSPDIVIMDINLPGMNGIDCIKNLKAKNNNILFMVFTIYENDEKVFEALKAGASSYILKKTEPAKIIDSIRELKEGGSPMSSLIARKLVNIFQKSKPIANSEASKLSKRELEILTLLSKGFLYKEIADQIGVTFGTVRQHVYHIYEKLHVHNRTEALNKVFGNIQ